MFKDLFTADLIGRLLRTVLQVAGGVIATKGWVDEATWATISGSLLTLGVTIFTVFASKKVTEDK